jgi:hypothetical protein
MADVQGPVWAANVWGVDVWGADVWLDDGGGGPPPSPPAGLPFLIALFRRITRR